MPFRFHLADDPKTMRCCADFLEHVADEYRHDYQEKPWPDPLTAQARVLRAVARRLRNRATRIQKMKALRS